MGRFDELKCTLPAGTLRLMGDCRPSDPKALIVGEPAIAEVLADEVIKQVMTRDGVAVEQLNELLNIVRRRLS